MPDPGVVIAVSIALLELAICGVVHAKGADSILRVRQLDAKSVHATQDGVLALIFILLALILFPVSGTWRNLVSISEGVALHLPSIVALALGVAFLISSIRRAWRCRRTQDMK